MPVEVISLLSSSAVSSPDVVRPKTRDRVQHAPPRASTREQGQDSTDISTKDTVSISGQENSGTTSNRPSTAVKRSVHDDHFLFLSDDFDTTGDLDVGFSKKPRLSPRNEQRRSKGERTLKRTTSAAQKISGSAAPLGPAGLKRWNSMADPIEFTSSPDPFTNSPKLLQYEDKGKGKEDVNPISSDPFASSPKIVDVKGKGRMKQKEPANTISSDPFASSPPRVQLNHCKQHNSWDPISSSAPELGATCHDVLSHSPIPEVRRINEVIELDDSFGSSSDLDLPDLHNIDFAELKLKKSVNDFIMSKAHKTIRNQSSKTSNSKKNPEEREREKQGKAEAREAEKERKKLEKEKAKEKKALEKEREKALTEVNKLRTDKKVSTPEMIVDLPQSLGAGLLVQIQTLLKDLDVQHYSYPSPVDQVIKWRRKVSCRWNEELGHWEPAPTCVESEDHVLVILSATDFVGMATGPEGSDLEAHVLKMKQHFERTAIIYLIEGLTSWMRKNRNIRNRQFVSAVRGTDSAAGTSSTGNSRRRAAQQEYIDEDAIEDALLSLQVLHDVMIHHTASPVETAQWVAIFTQHISTIPYRRRRDLAADAGFCMETGQVRTGDGPKDTYVRMLQEIARVTAPIAYGIAAEYPTVPELVKAFEAGGPLTVAECRKSANKDGAFSDRTVGQAISRRLYKIFTGRDETSTDV